MNHKFAELISSISDDSLFVFADSAIKGLFILLMVALGLMLIKKASAARRHLIWVLALLAVGAMPVLSYCLPAWQLPVLPEPMVRWQADVIAHRDVTMAPVDLPLDNAASNEQRPVGKLHGTPLAAAVVTEEATTVSALTWRQWILFIWTLGFGLAMLPLLIGAIALFFIRRSIGHVDDAKLTNILDRVRGQLGINRAITVLQSEKNSSGQTPAVWGVLTPVLLLPKEYIKWTNDRLESVLLHELAHIKRYDWLTQMVIHVIGAMHWFNPLVWFAIRRVRLEREKACDDLVLRAGVTGPDYAQHLLDIAKNVSTPRPLASLALAMARTSQVEKRLVDILNPTTNRSGLTRCRVAITVLVFAGIAMMFSTVRATGKDAINSKPPQEAVSLVDHEAHQLIKSAAIKLEALPKKNRTQEQTKLFFEAHMEGVKAARKLHIVEHHGDLPSRIEELMSYFGEREFSWLVDHTEIVLPRYLTGRDNEIVTFFSVSDSQDYVTALMANGTISKLDSSAMMLQIAEHTSFEEEFNEVYQLESSEVVKRIARPYIDARRYRYMRRSFGQYELIPRGPEIMTFYADDQGVARNWGMSFGRKNGLELSGVLDFLGMSNETYFAPDTLRRKPISGDWIVRKTASLEERQKGLQLLLQSELDYEVEFTQHLVKRDVILAAGNYKPNYTIEFDDMKDDPPSVVLYSDGSDETRGAAIRGSGTVNTVSELIELIGGRTGVNCYLVSKNTALTIPYNYQASASLHVIKDAAQKSQMLDQLLDNLSTQTNLVFKREVAEIPTWFVYPKGTDYETVIRKIERDAGLQDKQATVSIELIKQYELNRKNPV